MSAIAARPVAALRMPARVGLALVAAAQAEVGIWGLVAPHSFFTDFPGAGRHWVSALGPYDEHLLRDYAAAELGFALLLAAAAIRPVRNVVLAAGAAFLAATLPHLAYHLTSTDRLATADDIASIGGFALELALVAAAMAAAVRASTTTTEESTTMARLQPARPRGLDPIRRFTAFYSRRAYGRALAPMSIVAHNRPAMLGLGLFSTVNEKFAKTVEHRLKSLAMLRVAQLVGCEWCLDFGSKLAQDAEVPVDDLKALARWRDSDRFDATDRLVLEYAEAMTRAPVEVSDELFARLRDRFEEPQLVELTMAIGAENLYARTNWALGIEGEGFSDGMYCVVPDKSPAAAVEDVLATR